VTEPPAFTFAAELWQHEQAGWFFVGLPPDVADEVDELAGIRGGFGSIRVEVSIGSSRWQTSVFPDSKRGTFLLPIKKAVRSANDLDEGDVCSVRLALPEPARHER
jgi:hypothetical protein